MLIFQLFVPFMIVSLFLHQFDTFQGFSSWVVSINNFDKPDIMADSNLQQPSAEHSRVSSSSSSQLNQSYQLIPRQQPFSRLQRDLPSPRVSFPFRRVQPGLESSIHNRSHNDSRGTIKEQNKHERQSNQLIEAITQLNQSPKVPQNRDLYQLNQVDRVTVSLQQELSSRVKQLERKIGQLQQQIENERNQFELQKKANEIYTDGFTRIRQIVGQHCQLEGQSIEQVSQKLEQILKNRPQGDCFQIIEQQDAKIRQLRAQLLKSSQNNINAIFNTQITEAHCLHLQITKMNGQILSLKDNLLRVSTQGHELLPKDHVVNVYHHNQLDSQDQEDVNTQLKLTRRRRQSKNNSRKESSGSKMLSNTESKVGQLVEGYKILREEYKRLQQTIGQLYDNHSDYRHMFQSLRTQIGHSLEHQLKQVKQTLKRPSSSHSQKKIAKDIESKLNHLVNTLNAPERVNIEQNMGDDQVSDMKNVEFYRKLMSLQSHNTHLQEEIRHLEGENEDLKKKLWLQERNHLVRPQLSILSEGAH